MRILPPIIAGRLRPKPQPGIVRARAQTGSLLEGDTSDFHFGPFSVQGYYEHRNVAVALALVRGGETIIEVGANVGTETVSFSDIVGANGTVHAFEPLPSNVRWLRGLPGNVAVHEMALSECVGTAPFTAPPKHSSGTGHLSNRDGITVSVGTLDSMRLGRASLIVVDIEGGEVGFLRGARQYLSEYRPPLILEATPKLLNRAGSNIGELRSLLSDFGYSPFFIGRFVAQAVGQRAGNWLCLPDTGLLPRVNRYLLATTLLPCIRGLNPLTH